MNQLAWTPTDPPPIPIPPPLPVSPQFTGDRKGFFDLVARGAGLELVTLGFYRFWLVTDVRRHLWANTVVDGDAAEYTGRGRELLIGFLIAMAILMPIYLGYFLIGIEAERWQALASFPLIAAFYVFGQFAIYRARRYRLTRTIWRGVRFWMDGSGWAYAARATLWGVLAILTLGIAMPWRAAALERYKMRHSWYGDLQGDFEGRGWELFKRIWWLWLVTPIAVFIFPLLPFLYAHYKSVEWRWWLNGIRLGDVQVAIEPGAECAAGAVLEGDRLVDAAVHRVRRPAGRRRIHGEGNGRGGRARCDVAEHSAADRDHRRLSRAGARHQRGDATLSVARSLGQGAGFHQADRP